MRTYICTLYDIEVNIPELYSKDNDSFTEPIGLIMDKVKEQSSIVRQKLKSYFSSLELIAEYLTYPIARKGNSSRNSYLKTPTLLTAVIVDTKEADTYIITFTSDIAFSITNILGDAVGTGTTTAEFTSTDGVFKIETAKWIGEFHLNDKFIFAFETHEDILRLLTSYLVAETMLKNRYVSEQANTIAGLQSSYGEEAEKIFKQILETGELVLECAASDEGMPLKSQEKWHGYNVDNLGLLQEPPTS